MRRCNKFSCTHGPSTGECLHLYVGDISMNVKNFMSSLHTLDTLKYHHLISSLNMLPQLHYHCSYANHHHFIKVIDNRLCCYTLNTTDIAVLVVVGWVDFFKELCLRFKTVSFSWVQYNWSTKLINAFNHFVQLVWLVIKSLIIWYWIVVIKCS